MSKAKNKKVPERALPAFSKRGDKRVSVAVDPGSYYNKYPSWRFGRMYREKAYVDEAFLGFEALLEDADMVFPKLRDFDCSTWKELLQDANSLQNHHRVKVFNLADIPRRYIQNIDAGLEDLMSFRFDNTHRLYGKITADGAFEALMWDREHKVYPMAYKR